MSGFFISFGLLIVHESSHDDSYPLFHIEPNSGEGGYRNRELSSHRVSDTVVSDEKRIQFHPR